MTRRSFFSLLGRSTAAAVAVPYLPLLKRFAIYPVIRLRKIMARIRITQEAIDDPDWSAFSTAVRDEMNLVIKDAQQREMQAMSHGEFFWV